MHDKLTKNPNIYQPKKKKKREKLYAYYTLYVLPFINPCLKD